MTPINPHVPSQTTLRLTRSRLFFKTLHITTTAMKEGFELLDEIIMAQEQAPFGTAPGVKLFAPARATFSRTMFSRAMCRS